MASTGMEPKVVDESVLKAIYEGQQNLTIGDKISIVMNNEMKRDQKWAISSRLAYLDVVYDHLVYVGLQWEVCTVEWDEEVSKERKWDMLHLQPHYKAKYGRHETWDDLIKNSLMFPAIKLNSFADLYFKNKRGHLVVLKMWFGLHSNEKDTSLEALTRFLSDLKVPPDVLIDFYLFAPHSMADVGKLKIEGNAAKLKGR